MKPTMSSFVVLLFLLVIATTNIGSCNASSYKGCIKSERQALLKFKQDLNDPSNLLASWTTDGDCCKWVGIHCDNSTGHVLELRLRSSYDFDGAYIVAYLSYNRSKLGGKISPSLLDLKYLIYLDLSGTDFEGIYIPAFLGSMGNLRYLNLSYTGLIGMIPHQFGNLSNLQYLDLKQDLTYMHKLYVENFDLDMLFVDNFRWLSNLHSLKHLDLGGVNLSKTIDQWLLVSNVLPSLEVLKLSKCGIHHMPPLFIANFSSLTTLDLSDNQLFNYTLVPSWVFSLSQLEFLNLCGNNLQGPIPNEIQNLTSLKYLDLSENSFNLSIPNSLYRLNHLEYLHLQENNLQINLQDGIGNLTSIVKFDLSFNELFGKIPKSFGKLCNLKSIGLQSVKLSQNISEILDNLSQCVSKGLEELNLGCNQLFGHLTNQLGQFKKLTHFSVLANSISGYVPPSLGELSSLKDLVLSHNQFNGSLSQTHFANLVSLIEFAASGNSLKLELSPDWTPPFQLQYLKMTSCFIGPQFPSWILSQKKLQFLDIADSRIVDSIPSKFWKSIFQFYHLNLSHNEVHGKIPDLVNTTSALESLDLSSNNFSGPLPLISSNVHELQLSNNAFSGTIFNFLCYRTGETKRMQILNLGNNLLYGELPECFMYWKDLRVLNLSKNKFIGKLPSSLGTLSYLQSLNLRQNNLFQTLPMSLQNCIELVSLDLGENDFVGNIPIWIGEKFSNIIILILRSNKFYGPLPVELCRLAYLQILDISYNNLSGTIPRCIGNLSAMVTRGFSEATDVTYNVDSTIFDKHVEENILLVMKGKSIAYNTILKLVKSIDLSENNFSENIPIEITNLGALMSLNLSHNSLSGKIPEKIGVMRFLECIDLSENQLSGEIPQSISDLTFLSILNLSNNNLVGKIPLGTQLQSFNASSFTGNELCGLPLPKNCNRTGTLSISNHESGDEKDASENEVIWFFVSMALGFVVGFWSVIGSLLVNRRWRYMYCRFLDGLGEKFASVVNKCC